MSLGGHFFAIFLHIRHVFRLDAACYRLRQEPPFTPFLPSDPSSSYLPSLTPYSHSDYSSDTPTTAREKFGGQKAISSDMYFERGSYDPEATAVAKQRLEDFKGATSISSR